MKHLVNLDLNKNELQNARVQNLASAPGTPVVGQVYYDTVANAAYVWNGTAWRPADAAKLTDGTIPNTALTTNPLARANHTGTQAASTISDFDTQVRTSRLDQMAAPTASVAMNSQKITGLATPTVGTDAANKQYVDDTVAAISWKNEVRVATTANGTLASAFANGSTIDGVTLATNDRILIKDQSTQTENGIYTVNASGVPTRATDADSAGEINGAAVFVTNGTANQGTRWVCNTVGTVTLGATNITFVQFAGGEAYTAGNGLTLATNEFNVGAGTGISVAADAVSIDTAVVVRKYSATIGDNSATAIVVTHNLNTKDIQVQLRQVSDDVFVVADVTATSVNTCTITFAVAPASSAIRATVFA
ncbi:MAG: hypothetical protein IPQ25_17015 [Chitinophagaceae bacterium]|nr:hypothetical protein [Chitinophagaceae bacterium]